VKWSPHLQPAPPRLPLFRAHGVRRSTPRLYHVVQAGLFFALASELQRHAADGHEWPMGVIHRLCEKQLAGVRRERALEVPLRVAMDFE